MNKATHQIVIIGAGFGGLECTRALAGAAVMRSTRPQVVHTAADAGGGIAGATGAAGAAGGGMRVGATEQAPSASPTSAAAIRRGRKGRRRRTTGDTGIAAKVNDRD